MKEDELMCRISQPNPDIYIAHSLLPHYLVSTKHQWFIYTDCDTEAEKNINVLYQWLF